MSNFENYELYSFTVGCKHQRAFSVRSQYGVIADYMLAEACASESPIPRDFFSNVTISPAGDSLSVSTYDGSVSMTLNLDKIFITGKSLQQSQPFTESNQIREIAEHFMPGIFGFLNNPRVQFYGALYAYVHKNMKARSRFDHPAAKHLTKRLSSLPFTNHEYPADFSQRVSFRNRLPDGMVKTEVNDFQNTHLTFKAEKADLLWEPSLEEKQQYQQADTDAPAISTVSVDIQHVFRPERDYSNRLLGQHLDSAQKFLDARVIPELLQSLQLPLEQK